MATDSSLSAVDHSAATDRVGGDAALLEGAVRIARTTGDLLLHQYEPAARPADRQTLLAALRRNEQLALDQLLPQLTRLRPQAGWVRGELETGALPDGEWWAVDAVEGNINHIHGTGQWCVTVTLLRDQRPVLTVVRAPAWDVTYTALRDAGAHRNGRPMRVSAKRDLGVAIAATGQAEAGQTDTYQRIGASITAMLRHTLLVRASVPSTFPMLDLADGHADLFWQYRPTLPGVAAGLLLATEAGAVASRIDGSPWRPGSPDLLISAPALHAAAVAALHALT